MYVQKGILGETAAHDLLELFAYEGNGTSKLNQIRKLLKIFFKHLVNMN